MLVNGDHFDILFSVLLSVVLVAFQFTPFALHLALPLALVLFPFTRQVIRPVTGHITFDWERQERENFFIKDDQDAFTGEIL